ncbi:MAG: hypothetical protein ABR518_06480, partial [Actinomycetota bacterium]
VGYRGPVYGFAVYRPGPAAFPFILPGAEAERSDVDVAGEEGTEVVAAFGGSTTGLAYATDAKGRLLVFFWRTPEGRAEDFAEIFEHATDSILLSEGVQQTPASPPRATPLE